MKKFYEGMLGRGERPAEALRAAQIALWKSKGWDAPYYWAAFTLEGEWR
jgi:CHAT domain-containing protein